MKHVATIFLLLFYLLVSAGLSVKVHYCGKRISGVKVFAMEEQKCCCKKKSAKAKCCSEKEVQLKLEEVHNSVSTEITSTPKQITTEIFLLVRAFVFSPLKENLVANCSNAPPLLQSLSLHIFHSVFRI